MRPYIDCHNHIGRTINRRPPVGQTTAMSLARFAETNIYAAVSMPTSTGSPMARGVEDIRDQNRAIATACRDFPDRFPIGLALAEPRLGHLAVGEAEWAMSELGLVGTVTHPPVIEACIPFVELVASRDGLCNAHIHSALMGEIARMYPRATFIVHASTYAIENFAQLDNVWFEIVQYPDGPGSEWDFRWMANRAGRERLIFGADLPYYDYRGLQRTIEQAAIDADLKDCIAFKNIIALIRKFKPGWTMPDTPIRSPGNYPAEELWAVNPDNPVRLTVYA